MKRIILLIGACVCMHTALAQQELMRITPDAQSLGMGGVSVTSTSGAHAIFNNPASAAFSRQRMQLSGSYISLERGHGFGASGYYNFDGRNILEAGWRRRSHSSSSHMSFEAGYARRLGEKWSIGATLRYYHYLYYDWSGSRLNALAADVSAMYSQPLNLGEYSTLRLGGKIGNLGGYIGKDTGDRPEISGAVGIALDTFITDSHELTVGLDINSLYSQNNPAEYGFSLGAEYNLMQLIQLRAGYHYTSQDYDYYGSYLALGAGVRFLHVRLDFAYLFYNSTRRIWSISAGFDF